MLNAGAEGAEIEETDIQGGSRSRSELPCDQGSRDTTSLTKLGHGSDPKLWLLFRLCKRPGRHSSGDLAHPEFSGWASKRFWEGNDALEKLSGAVSVCQG